MNTATERIDAQIAALQEQKRTLLIEQAARQAERDRMLAQSPFERRAEIRERIIAHRKAVNAAEALAARAVR